MKVVKFENTGVTFSALYAAQEWLKANGYSYGSLCGPGAPVAVCRGEYRLPQKWRNMDKKERAFVDGRMEASPDFRSGEVKVTLRDQ